MSNIDRADAGVDKQPTTFKEFDHFDYRLCPIVPPDAPPDARMLGRINRGNDARGKMPGIRYVGTDGFFCWRGFDFTVNEPDAATLQCWQEMGAGIGIKTGPLDGDTLVLIDADTKNSTSAALIRATVEKYFDLLPTRIGNAPKAGYVLRIKGEFPYTRVEFGERDAKGRLLDRVELLADKRMFVAHGIHPVTMQPYRWPRALVPYASLKAFEPHAVLAFMRELEALLPAAKPMVQEGGGAEVNQAQLKGNLEHVTAAVKAIRNTSKHFPTREAWRDMAYMIKGALQDCPDEAFALFDEWSDRWEDDTNEPGYAATEWARMKPPFRVGARQLYRLADRIGDQSFTSAHIHFGPIPDSANPFDELEREQSANWAKQTAVEISATPYGFPDPASLPLREWIYGRFYERGLVAMTVAPGGLGKSLLSIVEALAMTSGKPLLGKDKPHGKFRVWLWNGEDPSDELNRRVAAAMTFYKLTAEDLGDRLFIDSGFDLPLVLARKTRDGAALDEATAAALTAELRRRRIDVLLVDPFVSTHRVSELDNDDMDLVGRRWARIAHDAGVALGLVHHSKKTQGVETQVEDARGASALMNVMRAGRALTRMTPIEGRNLGVGADYWKYFRLSGVSKTSRAPQTGPGVGSAEWLTAASVSLGNGGGTALDAMLNGDSVGVVACANFTEQAQVISESDKLDKHDEIIAALRVGEWREDVQADAWAGKAVANVLGLDPKADRDKIKSVLARLCKLGRTKTVLKMAEKSKQRAFLAVVDTPRATIDELGEDNSSPHSDIFG